MVMSWLRLVSQKETMTTNLVAKFSYEILQIIDATLVRILVFRTVL